MRNQIAAGMMLALLCTSCSGHSSGSAPATKARPPSLAPTTVGDPLDDPASAHRIVYDPGMVSDPLPVNPPDVSVTAAQAVAAISRTPNHRAESTRPTSTLRMVTTGTHRTRPGLRRCGC
jgi:hypothetical protein